MAHGYRVKYKLEPEAGNFTAEECKEAGGGCDALVLISMLFPEHGSYSQMTISFDGRNDGTPLRAVDWWQPESLDDGLGETAAWYGGSNMLR